MITDGTKWYYLSVKKYISIIKRNNIKKSKFLFVIYTDTEILFERNKRVITIQKSQNK